MDSRFVGAAVMAALLACSGAEAAFAQDAAGPILALGDKHTCVLDTTGTAYCWGANSEGQLGRGSTSPKSDATPVAVAADAVFASLTAGANHTCGVTVDHAALCWGSGKKGQLGGGGQRGTATPLPVAGGLRFRKLVAGSEHTCGIASDGAAYCWGNAKDGRLGVGDSRRKCGGDICATPQRVELEEPLVDIAAGKSHTCAVGQTGTAYCWGDNGHGRLGVGERTGSKTIPEPVSAVTAFTHITAGDEHTCALTTDSRAQCWGWNIRGQVGDGTKSGEFWGHQEPVRVAGDLEFTGLMARGNATCGLLDSGHLVCWGHNSNEQLGPLIERGTEQRAPALAANVAFRAFAIGPNHSCGFSHDNDLYCWGHSGDGRLGHAVQAADAPGRFAYNPRPLPVTMELADAPGSNSILELAPNGLSGYDATIRRFLATGHADSVRLYSSVRVPGANTDDLLRALQQGVALRYAGDLDGSLNALDRAIEVHESRGSPNLSQAVLSALAQGRVGGRDVSGLAARLLNSGTPPFTLLPTERAFVNYYYMLNCFDLGDRGNAGAVARTLAADSAGHQGGGDGDHQESAAERSVRGVLAALGAAVLHVLGDRAEANAGLQRARALTGSTELGSPFALEGDSAEIVLAIERGFVPHKVASTISVPVTEEELTRMSSGTPESRIAAAAPLTAAVIPSLKAQVERGLYQVRPGQAAISVSRSVQAAGQVQLGWPLFRQDSEAATSAAVSISGGPTRHRLVLASVSDAVTGEFERLRPALLARALTRAAEAEAARQEAQRRASGAVTLSNILRGVAATTAATPEAADTRAWHLLPAELGVVRLRVRPGTHLISVQFRMRDGSTRDAQLEPVTVEPGQVVIHTQRVWF